jgi:hypothetical protein
LVFGSNFFGLALALPMVIAIELKFGIHRHLLALCGFDDAAQRKADALAFPLMLVFSTFIGTLLSEYSLKDVLISQGIVIVLISLWR